jgi:hypothetical protein
VCVADVSPDKANARPGFDWSGGKSSSCRALVVKQRPRARRVRKNECGVMRHWGFTGAFFRKLSGHWSWGVCPGVGCVDFDGYFAGDVTGATRPGRERGEDAGGDRERERGMQAGAKRV